jgi:uncharacterized membrane protein YGL010W
LQANPFRVETQIKLKIPGLLLRSNHWAAKLANAFGVIEAFMSESFLANYKAKHQHPLNRLSHSIGIPMIVVSLPLFLFNWRWALVLFIVGWILQFVGHAIEGNQPAFFKNPVYLLVGPLWLLRRAASVVGLVKSRELK